MKISLTKSIRCFDGPANIDMMKAEMSRMSESERRDYQQKCKEKALLGVLWPELMNKESDNSYFNSSSVQKNNKRYFKRI